MTNQEVWNRSSYAIAVLFVVAQICLCFLFEAAEEGRTIAGCIVGLSLILVASGKGLKVSRLVHSSLLTSCAGLFALHAASRYFSELGIDVYELFEILASFLLVVQSFELLRDKSNEMLEDWKNNYLPGLGTLVLILLFVASDVSFSLAAIERLFLSATVLLALLMRPDFLWLVLHERSRRQAILLASIVATTLAAALLFQGEVVRQIPLLQEVVRKVQSPIEERERLFRETKARMVDRVDLSSISKAQQSNPEEMVFKVESTDPPGYMRTLSFEQFDGMSWFNVWERDRSSSGPRARRIAPLLSIPPELNLSGKSFELELFPLGNPVEKQAKELLVTIPSNHGLFVPLPENSTHILAEPGGRVRQLLTDLHGNVWPNSIRNDQYRVFVGTQAVWPSEDGYLDRLLQMSKDDAALIERYSKEVCEVDASVREKAQQIAKFFDANFTYSFAPDAIGSLNGRSPLRAFLENRQAGHCEYFATASVLLLRAHGIPARLSTGYVVYERDIDEDYYYARNKDAHAWAEAFDRATGEWIVVESTPGIQSTLTQISRRDNDDAAKQKESSTGQGTLTVRFSQFVQAAWNRIVSLGTIRFAWFIPVAFAGCWLGFRMLRHHQLLRPRNCYVSKQVKRADRLAARLGLQRSPHETCEQFANRLFESPTQKLNELGYWYVQHGQKRYL